MLKASALFETAVLDQRHTPRIEVDLLAEYTSNKQHAFLPVINMSQGGLSIKPLQGESANAQISLLLPFQDGQESMKVTGQVAWCKSDCENQLGVRFVDLTRDQKIRLANFLLVSICR